MKSHQYEFKSYLNATHAIHINGIIGQRHPHTWEFVVTVINGGPDDFLPFHEVEEVLEGILNPYQDKHLNDIEPFVFTNPTLENICEKFKEILAKTFLAKDWILLKVMVSETPSRTYFIDLIEELDEITLLKEKTSYSEEVDAAALSLINHMLTS